LRGLDRSLGSRSARARGGAARALHASACGQGAGQEGLRGQDRARVVVPRSGARDRQAHGAVRVARRSAPRSGGGRAAVSQVRRPGEEPGQEAASGWITGSRVSRRREGWKGELYRPGAEGCERVRAKGYWLIARAEG